MTLPDVSIAITIIVVIIRPTGTLSVSGFSVCCGQEKVVFLSSVIMAFSSQMLCCQPPQLSVASLCEAIWFLPQLRWTEQWSSLKKKKNVKPRRLLSTSLLFKHAQDPGEIPWDQWYTLLRQFQVVRQRCSLMSIKTWRFFSQRINSIPSLDRCKQVSHLVNREKISRALATVFTWFHY